VGLIAYFGERQPLLSRAMRSKTSLWLAADPFSAAQVAALSAVDDPALLALPSLQGFSGKAWLSFPAIDYPLSDWTEPPPFLALDVSRLGETFSSFVGSNGLPDVALTAKPAPEIPGLQISVPPLPVPVGSEFRVEGALQSRRLLGSIEVPAWPHDELLTNTVVQVLVDDEGNTLSTTLLTSSGSKGADAYALNQSSGARFEPVLETNAPPARSVFGRLIFQWQTAPLSRTNSVPVRR
jgi:hypothetical protein